MRNAYMEKEEAKKLKQKQRDRMSAKTGKMDIAYEVGMYDVLLPAVLAADCMSSATAVRQGLSSGRGNC